jgi:sigma-B regulation protein RsbU (phosphoserine phosphatase)
MEDQLNLAREIQQAAFSSKLPVLKHAKGEVLFHHRYQPASKLAGDFFEVFPLGEGQAGFFVCDVMGHGVRSALIVSMLRGLTEQQHLTVGTQPGLFLTGLNDGLCHLLERTSQMIFATAIYGVVDLLAGEVRLAAAGHPDPLVRRDGRTTFLKMDHETKGPGLGVVPDFSFHEISIPIKGLEGIWAFTDGVFEVLGEDGEEFGPERLRDAMQHAGAGVEAINNAVEVACLFSAEDAFDDDLCILGVEFAGGA